MRMDRRLVLVGVLLIILSMTMATQYATTTISYSFAIVHPSNADIRFIGSDNSSDDGLRCLRISNNASNTQFLTLELGDWAPGQTKNYTAAFGVINEENFTVDITHVEVSGINSTEVDLWIHGNRTEDYPNEGDCPTRIMVVQDGAELFGSSDTVWQLGAGDGNVATMNASSADIATLWDTWGAHVQYSLDNTNAVNGTSDFVWIGVGIDLETTETVQAASGTIKIFFSSTTDT